MNANTSQNNQSVTAPGLPKDYPQPQDLVTGDWIAASVWVMEDLRLEI
ncbi:MAG: hypothetical protein PCFJNLEI_03230 [Verrucomicrobiae bacterium]|nr:hypothetical protein [Verrucomicrobiae bacterium]